MSTIVPGSIDDNDSMSHTRSTPDSTAKTWVTDRTYIEKTYYNDYMHGPKWPPSGACRPTGQQGDQLEWRATVSAFGNARDPKHHFIYPDTC